MNPRREREREMCVTFISTLLKTSILSFKRLSLLSREQCYSQCLCVTLHSVHLLICQGRENKANDLGRYFVPHHAAAFNVDNQGTIITLFPSLLSSSCCLIFCTDHPLDRNYLLFSIGRHEYCALRNAKGWVGWVRARDGISSAAARCSSAVMNNEKR